MEIRQPEFFDDDELSLVPSTEEEPKEEEKEEGEIETPGKEEEEEEEISTTVTAEDAEFYNTHFELWKERGVLALPDDYKFEASEEGLNKALEDSRAYIKEQVLDELSSSLPAKGIELLNFMIETGSDDISAFIESQREPDFSTLEVDEENEDLQENLVRLYLKNTTKYSDDRIEKEITRYKLDKELFTQATEARTELAAIQAEARENAKKAAADAEAERKRQAKEATEHFHKTVSELTEYNGLQFTKEDARNITESIFKPIKDSQGNVTTKFNQKLEEVLRDPKKTAVLAKLLEKDLNLEQFKKPLEKKAAATLKQKLDRAALPVPKGKSTTDANGFDWDSVTLVRNK